MPRPAHGRCLQRAPVSGVLALNTGQAEQVLHVLVAENLEQRQRRNRSDEPPIAIYDGDGCNAMLQRVGRHVLLVIVGPHARVAMIGEPSDRLLPGGSQQIHEADRSLERMACIDDIDGLHRIECVSCKAAYNYVDTLALLSHRYAGDDMVSRAFGRMLRCADGGKIGAHFI
ncbi:MAG TPA: hypothetical protein VI072_33825, partial [Polyangiaceae bacterium]